MTDLTIEQVTIPSYCQTEKALHKKETGIFSKSELRLMRNIDFVNLSCGVLFPYNLLRKRRERSFRRATKRLFTEHGIHSEQSRFYLNIPYGQLKDSEQAQVGDKITFGETRYASPDANLARNGLGNSVVFEIANSESLVTVALPSEIFTHPLYIFPLTTTFRVTNIRVEDWVCGARLSCPKTHSNVKVITLESA